MKGCGGVEDIPYIPDDLVEQSFSGVDQGLDEIDVYDEGPTVYDDDLPGDAEKHIIPVVKAEDIRPMWEDELSRDSVDLAGSSIVRHLTDLGLGKVS